MLPNGIKSVFPTTQECNCPTSVPMAPHAVGVATVRHLASLIRQRTVGFVPQAAGRREFTLRSDKSGEGPLGWTTSAATSQKPLCRGY